MKRLIIAATICPALIFFPLISHSDDNIITGGWKHESRRHPMLDTVSCSVILQVMAVPSPFIEFNADGKIMFGAVAKLYPGKPLAIRIDENKALIGKEWVTEPAASTAIEQIKAGGKNILLMVQQWPKGTIEYVSADLAGIVEQIDACQKIVKEQ